MNHHPDSRVRRTGPLKINKLFTILTFKLGFQDVHVMIIVGFGFLMTFLKRYSWSSLGFNFLFTAFTVQWAILVQGWFFDSAHHGDDHNDTNGTAEAHTGSDISHLQFIHVDLLAMIEAEFSSGCILISFGAVLGVASPVQLLIMIILEIVFYKVSLSAMPVRRVFVQNFVRNFVQENPS